MRVPSSRLFMSVLVTAILSACGSSSPGPSSRPQPPTTSRGSSPSPSTTSTTRTTNPMVPRSVDVALPRISRLSKSWRQAFSVPYGPARSEVGAEDSHGGATTPWGPAGGVPAADGSWYVIDTSKHRVAHYDRTGRFLDDLAIPGKYVGLEAPHLFDRSNLFANGGARDALVVCHGTAQRVPMTFADGTRPWSYDDGHRAYSLANDGTVHTAGIDGCRLVIGTADAFRTPAGRRFTIRYNPAGDTILLNLLDAGVQLELHVHAAEPTSETLTTHLTVAAEADSTLDLVVEGAAGTQGYGGYLQIAPDGTSTAVEPIRSVTTEVTTGIGTLHVIPTTNTAALFIVAPDGVHVYLHTNA